MRLAALLITALAGLAGCGGGGGIGGTGAPPVTDSGSLRLAITDAPSCGYDAVNITIQKVRVNQSSGAGDGDGGWVDVALPAPAKINLLSLSNGVLLEIGQTALPVGHYTQLRLVLADNGGATPLANSVVPSGGTETALTTPSAQQSGLKVKTDMEVSVGQLADFVIDFDACKSVVKRGNSGQYNLKPVMSVVPRATDAGMRVLGYVAPAIALGSTQVSLQAGGVPVKATVPDANGQFVLYPVPAGSYDLVISAAGRATAVMTGVPVAPTANTTVNTSALAILPPALVQPTRNVSGTVTPTSATVRATQTLAAGPPVEVQWAPVDAQAGTFAFNLALDAPVRTAYVANPATLVFAPDAAVAGRYTVEAASADAVKTKSINVNAVVPPLVFSFP